MRSVIHFSWVFFFAHPEAQKARPSVTFPSTELITGSAQALFFCPAQCEFIECSPHLHFIQLSALVWCVGRGAKKHGPVERIHHFALLYIHIYIYIYYTITIIYIYIYVYVYIHTHVYNHSYITTYVYIYKLNEPPQTGVNNFDPYPAGTDFTGCFQKPHTQLARCAFHLHLVDLSQSQCARFFDARPQVVRSQDDLATFPPVALRHNIHHKLSLALTKMPNLLSFPQHGGSPKSLSLSSSLNLTTRQSLNS